MRDKAHEAAALYTAAQYQKSDQARIEMQIEGLELDLDISLLNDERNVRLFYTTSAFNSHKVLEVLQKYAGAAIKLRKERAIFKPMEKQWMRTGEKPGGFDEMNKKYIRTLRRYENLTHKLDAAHNEWVDNLPA